MEFGELLFECEDDGKNEVRKSSNNIDMVLYEPKHCQAEWFISVDQREGEDDSSVVVKYRADLSYYKGHYETARVLYTKLLQILPVTYSQLQREVTDSLVRCCIRVGCGEEGLKWAIQLVHHLSNSKEHSSWDLLATCHQLCAHIKDEVICRLKCVLLSRHYPTYWIKLFHAYSKLLNSTIVGDLEKDCDILRYTSELFRPYFNKRSNSDHCAQYQLFITTLTTPNSPVSPNTLEEVLTVASMGTLLRANQLLQYSLDHSTYTEQVKKQIDQVMKMVAVFGHDDLQSLIEQFMQKPSEIEI